jgi:hypothetical protein
MTTHADTIIEILNLAPHPEGGYFRETFLDQRQDGRAWSTAILYLLKAGERPHWHHIDAAEIWHWYARASLELRQVNVDRKLIVQTFGDFDLAPTNWVP